MKNRILSAFLPVLACFGFLSRAQAVSPTPDGCYPNFTTAEGCNALNLLTTGLANTAIGWFSLSTVTTGSYNTGVGAGSLDLNTGDENTATGTAALLLNTTGVNNTANGAFALVMNSSGRDNTAVGDRALQSNIDSKQNTAVGSQALTSHTTGTFNDAVGAFALYFDTTGVSNNAFGDSALFSNDTGIENTGVGDSALFSNISGSNNTALGAGAGANLTTGDNNIDIGYSVGGVAGESNTIRIGNSDIATTIIRGIFDQTSSGGIPVLINSNGTLGTMTSSARFKQDIKPMDKASEALFALKPVAFRYKKEIDPTGTSQFGLVAEDVEKVNADLIVCDKEGKPFSVRYDQVNAMLLNEFLKEHRKVEQQRKDFEVKLAKQEEQIEALAAGLRKVSAQLEGRKHSPQIALGDQ